MSAPKELPVVLDVEAVMRRYGLRDRRVARRIMDEAGAFLVGRRLVVRLDDLDAYEHRRKQERAAPMAPPPRAREKPCCGGPRKPARSRERAPLRPGWWRESGGEG